jgi:hypothetical protein
MELSCRIQPCQGRRPENEVVWLRQYRLLLQKIRSACLLVIRMLQAVYAFIGSHHLMEAFVPPSSRYPDIYPVTNVLVLRIQLGLAGSFMEAPGDGRGHGRSRRSWIRTTCVEQRKYSQERQVDVSVRTRMALYIYLYASRISRCKMDPYLIIVYPRLFT